MQDGYKIVGLCVNQILAPVNHAFQHRTQLSASARALCAAHIHIWCQYPTSQIFLKTVTTEYNCVENSKTE